MSQSVMDSSLCERCKLLSFDDLALGGVEVVDEGGVARLSFPDDRKEYRRDYRMLDSDESHEDADYTLVPLKWYLEDTFPNMPNLSRSCKDGCAFCKSISSQIQNIIAVDETMSNPHKDQIIFTMYLSLTNGAIEGLLLEGWFDESQHENQHACDLIQMFFCIKADSVCDTWLGVERVCDRNHLDPKNIQELRDWLDECSGSCHPWTSSSFLPTRLIDVGTNASDAPRLVLSSDIFNPKETKYAALSYCWGNEEDSKAQTKTERASLKQRCEYIPYQSVTPAIGDAITLTRAIGLRYVWVDALCIIQDDRDDWVRESSQMGLVYRNAFVTFCGLNSDSCHQSLFHKYPTVKVSFQSKIRKSIHGHYLIQLRPQIGYHRNRQARQAFGVERATSKWTRRAWTYQEEILSVRLVYLGGMELYFKCGEPEWSQGDGNRTQRSHHGLLNQLIEVDRDEDFESSIHTVWILMLQEYGRRSATQEIDRLPAISGLARIIGEILDRDYLAGIWAGGILRGICWGSIPTGRISHGLQVYLQSLQERNYVAPSWSWASCNGAFGFMFWSDQLVAASTVVDYNVNVELQEPFGQVSGGFLEMLGKVTRLASSTFVRDADRLTYIWRHYIPDAEPWDSVVARLDWLHDGKQAEEENLHMMFLSHYQHEGEDFSRMFALMLYPTKIPNQYYRVGLIYSDGALSCAAMEGWFADCEDQKICLI